MDMLIEHFQQVFKRDIHQEYHQSDNQGSNGYDNDTTA